MEFPVSDMRQMIGLDGFASQPKCNANNLFFTCVPLKYQACGAASAATGAKNATQSIDRNNKNIGAEAIITEKNPCACSIGSKPARIPAASRYRRRRDRETERRRDG